MRQQKHIQYVVLYLGLAGFGVLPGPAQSEHDLAAVKRAELCITKGAIEEQDGSRLEVTVPEMRAVVASPTRQVAEAKLTYLGHTTKDKPLASGELRRQFGLKLRAQNGCNLVYVMWRIAPKSELVVSYKSNPGMTTNAECDTHGYHTLTPTRALAVPHLKVGKDHSLQAVIAENKLHVSIDGKIVWEGVLAQEALAFDGPIGVRTDNGRFKFQLLATLRPGSSQNPPCHAADGDD